MKTEPVSRREEIYEDLVTRAEVAGWWESVPSIIPVKHPDSQRFHDLLRELGELHDRKQATYGRPDSPFSNYLSSEELGIPPWRYVVARVCEKMSRLQSFAKKNQTNEDQTIRELKDIAACSIIAVVLMEKDNGRQVQSQG